jgi:hypothetical protein
VLYIIHFQIITSRQSLRKKDQQKNIMGSAKTKRTSVNPNQTQKVFVPAFEMSVYRPSHEFYIQSGVTHCKLFEFYNQKKRTRLSAVPTRYHIPTNIKSSRFCKTIMGKPDWSKIHPIIFARFCT